MSLVEHVEFLSCLLYKSIEFLKKKKKTDKPETSFFFVEFSD